MPTTISNKLIAILVCAILAISLVPAVAMPQAARASEMTAAQIVPQSSATNTAMSFAQELKSGVAVIGSMDYIAGKEGYTYYESSEAYWYKFKTSGRNSTYSLSFESIDRGDLMLDCYDADGLGSKWFNGVGGVRLSDVWSVSTGYKLDADRNSWYYFRVFPWSNIYNRYDRYKITVTEHPVIKKVSAVKSIKRAKKSLTIKWSKQSNATKYQVKYKAKGGSWKTVTAAKNSVKLSKLKKGTSYQVKVRAYSKDGWDATRNKTSNWSSWSTAKKIKTKS